MEQIYIHPKYNNYGCNRNGDLYYIEKQRKLANHYTNAGYQSVTVGSSYGDFTCKTAHRFIWECINGNIEEGLHVDHINNDKKDNRIENLQLLTRRANNKKSAVNRNYNFVRNNHINKKLVKATDENGNVSYYDSLYAVNKELGINAGQVKMICEGINNVKSGFAKYDNYKRYTFQYINEVPENATVIKSRKQRN